MAKTRKSGAQVKRKAVRRKAVPKVKSGPVRKPASKKPTARVKGPIVFYGHFNSMPAAKVRLMLALTGTPFKYRHVDLREGAQRRPEYLAMNRFGQVPVLQHGDVTLAQSNVILRYLADQVGRMGGGSDAERREISQWLDFEADLMSSGIRALRAAVRFLNADPAVRQFFRARAERALNTLDTVLAGQDFLTGSRPTIADIAVLPHLTVADEAEFDLAPYANVRAWIDRMMKLPGAGHPYDLMPKEDRDQA